MHIDWYDRFMVGVGFLISCSVLPHVHQMYLTQSSLGQSWVGPTMLEFGLICWIIYGVRHDLYTVVVTNILAVVFNALYIGTILYYR